MKTSPPRTALSAGSAFLLRVLGSRGGFLLAFLMLIPSSLVRGGDGVGVDGLIGSLPQRRGPNGECFFTGLAASFVPLAGDYWGQVPSVDPVLVFEGEGETIANSILLSGKVTSFDQFELESGRLVQAYGCDADITVDYRSLATAGCNTFLQLPANFSLTMAAASSSNGIVLSPAVSAFARHYYFNLEFVAFMIDQLHLPDVELYFVDPQGFCVRVRFTMEHANHLRIRVN